LNNKCKRYKRNKKNRKGKRRKEGKKRKYERGPGEPFGPVLQAAHGPPKLTEMLPSFLHLSL
jgi:hypothetical protein